MKKTSKKNYAIPVCIVQPLWQQGPVCDSDRLYESESDNEGFEETMYDFE